MNGSSGLSESTNSFIDKDRSGNVWISSLNGLNRLSGRNLKLFRLYESGQAAIYGKNIQSPFFEDQNNDIWFTTTEPCCVSVYKAKQGVFGRRFIIENKDTIRPVDCTAVCLERKRWLWVLADERLYRMDTRDDADQHSQYLHNLQAVRFAADTFADGGVRRVVACYWSYKKGCEIIDYDKNAQPVRRRVFFSATSDNNTPVLTVRQALIENDTLIWLATDKGLAAFNPERPASFRLYSVEPFGGYTRNLAMDAGRRLFVSTDRTPLLAFDKTAGIFTPVVLSVKNQDESSRPFQNGANELYIDPSNTIWISAAKEGVYYASLVKYFFSHPFIPVAGGAAKGVYQVSEEKKGSVWISTVNGLHQFDNAKKMISGYKVAARGRFIFGPHQSIWKISPAGFLQFLDKKNNRVQTVWQTPGEEFMDVVALRDTFLLIAGNRSLIRYDFIRQKMTPDLLNQLFFRLTRDRFNGVWGNSEPKIIRFQIKNDQTLAKNYEIDDAGLVNHFFYSGIDSSIMWAATSKGLLKINIKTLTYYLFSEKDGLTPDIFQSVLEDKKGNLWCGTDRGIVCYNPKAKTTRRFTTRDGLSADAYNANAAMLSSTGEMWFGSVNGLDVFNPDSVRNYGSAPQLAITGLKIHDKPWTGDSAIEVKRDVRLKYDQNTLNFELAAMEYTDPELNQFKVFLQGYDKQWTDLHTQNFITYANLPSGDYHFQFKACNSEGIWNETPRVLRIVISPPFWKTLWFIALCVLAAAALAGYIFYLRVSKILDLQEIRIKLYENLHDDLGSRLTAAVMLADQGLQKINRPEAAEFADDNVAASNQTERQTLTEMREIARGIVANMRRLVWATDFSNDELINVVHQMQADKKILLPHALLTVNIDEALKGFKVNGNTRYQMLSIFGEALTNSAKYAEATKVIVTLQRCGDRLVQTIRDNGKGFDSPTLSEETVMSGGRGFGNMARRAQRINGVLDIESEKGKGTTVRLTVPLHSKPFWRSILRFFSRSHSNR